MKPFVNLYSSLNLYELIVKIITIKILYDIMDARVGGNL